MKGKLEKTHHLLDEVRIIQSLGFVSIVVGTIITIYGFFSWYILVQKPLDEKLKAAGSKEGAQSDATGDG